MQKTVAEEYRAAITPDIDSPDRGREILLMGNSILDAAVNTARLKSLVADQWRLKRLYIPATSYLDWYYGIRRLLSDGAQPTQLWLMLTWHQLAMSEIRGEYFSHYMMLARDFPNVANRLNLHRTAATSLLFGHFSAFYGARSEIRTYVLGHLLPDLPGLTNMIRAPRQGLSEETLLEVAKKRLESLRDVASAHGMRFVFVLAPPGTERHASILKTAGQQAGVPVIIGWSGTDFVASDFTDGFHLNDAAAERYTNLLAHELLRQRNLGGL